MKYVVKNVKTLKGFLGPLEELRNSGDELVNVELLFEGDSFVGLFKAGENVETDATIIDGRDQLLLPGLIDPQVHFREPGGEHKETLESGIKSAIKGGVTTVICMPNTNPTSDSPEVLKYIIDKSNQIGLGRVLPTACVTIGLGSTELVDFKALKDAGAIAFTDDGRGVQSDELMEQAMTEIAKLGMALLDHPEDEDLSKKGSIHAGVTAKKHNIPGIDPEAEIAHVKRGCAIAKKTGCHYHVLHVSSKGALDEVLKGKAQGAPVTAEVSPHHLLLCDEDIPIVNGKLDANFKMNPPLRSDQDRKALQEALIQDKIDVIATDHAPHAEDEKSLPITEAPFGIVGVENSFSLLYTNFVKTGKVTLSRLVSMMTYDAAKLFKVDLGCFETGTSADFILVDLKASETIDSANFATKGKNSPFVGQEVFGLVSSTYYKGKNVYQR